MGQPWRAIPGKGLLFLLTLFTAVALTFEGYNQGVLGTVSTTPGFIEMAQIGSNGKVTNSTKQGGLAAAYYFGAMWGCFIGGWAGDKLGRKKGGWIGSIWCMLGAALMSGSVNANVFICARVIAGIGIGFINGKFTQTQYFLFTRSNSGQLSFHLGCPSYRKHTIEAPISRFSSWPTMSESSSPTESTSDPSRHVG